jgi:hypothetical protein
MKKIRRTIFISKETEDNIKYLSLKLGDAGISIIISFIIQNTVDGNLDFLKNLSKDKTKNNE